jgi:hypothetical protein
MGLPGEKHQQEENPGRRNRELRSPKGDAARDWLRHRQLPLAGNPDRALPCPVAGKPRYRPRTVAEEKRPVRPPPYIVADERARETTRKRTGFFAVAQRAGRLRR